MLCNDPNRTDSKTLNLNIGGTSYRIRKETILQRSHYGFLYRFLLSSHEKRLQVSHDYLPDSNEYFFERSGLLFNSIYQYYVSGERHKPEDICATIFKYELEFWNLKDVFSDCHCQAEVESLFSDEGSTPEEESENNEFAGVCCGCIRRLIWNTLEVPGSTQLATFVSLLSLVAVLTSNISLVLASIPEFHVSDTGTNHTKPHPLFDYIECCCVIWFSFEYLAKLIVTTQRIKVFLEVLNLVDLVAILPFYIEYTLYQLGVNSSAFKEFQAALLVVRILRVLRIVRLFKLGRYSNGLRMFGKTVTNSKEQLGMLVVVLGTGVMFFSTLVYFLEKSEPTTDFSSIPAAFWWCLVTMTTVGYGDFVPQTIGGKVVGACAIASGMLVLALPITIIVDNFMKVQEEERQINAKKEKKELKNERNSRKLLRDVSHNAFHKFSETLSSLSFKNPKTDQQIAETK